jgi:hypothetical protein
MTHPTRRNNIETNRPGAIAKDPVCSRMNNTKFLLLINNWLWREKQFYQFSKIQMPIWAKFDFYHLFSIYYIILMKKSRFRPEPVFCLASASANPDFRPTRAMVEEVIYA